MITIAVIIWCLLGIAGMCYQTITDGDDITLGNFLFFCILGPVIGHIVAIAHFMVRHPIVLWRNK